VFNRACKMFSLAAVAASVLIPGWAETTGSAGTAASPSVSEVSIPNTRRFEFVSKVSGRRYAISVSIPFIPVPTRGYSVLYVMDGNWYFGSASEATRDWNAPGVVVVGIGYPLETKPMWMRFSHDTRRPSNPRSSTFHGIEVRQDSRGGMTSPCRPPIANWILKER
jgi:hypothetical protein